MKRKERDHRPYIRPVLRVELPEMNVKLRWIAIVLLLSIAVVAIGLGVYNLVDVEPGWHTVEVSSKGPSTSTEFTFQYDFTGAGSMASAQLRQISEVYRQASEDAFQLFSPDVDSEMHNVRYLNQHPGEIIKVEPALYQALSVFDESTIPYLFLAPAYPEYDHVFLCRDDADASRYDPTRNEEIAQWLGELAAFINDPAHISLELLGENQVRLNVSAEYLAFAAENETETFLEFGWMKNAFAADFIADILVENGFTNGYLASYDGFTRNLDSRGTDYGLTLFDRRGSDLHAPAGLHYSGPMSLVALRDYPISERDRWHYYAYQDGRVLTTFLDPADAMSRASIPNLLGYARDQGCGEILEELLPVFVAESFAPQSLGQKADAIWFENGELRYTGPALERMPTTDGVEYKIP